MHQIIRNTAASHRRMRFLLRGFFLVHAILQIAPSLHAQDFTAFDTGTYRLYQEKEWDRLIRAGRSALDNGLDYYYLRMRIGIAYYEKQNYKEAQGHFRKALLFNEGDPGALEYLYYAYLFGGQIQQAELVYRDMPASLKERLPDPGQKAVDRISVEYLYNQSFTDDLIKDPGTFEGLPYGFKVLTRDFQNLSASMHHFMHPGTSFMHAYTYLSKKNYYYYNDGLDRFTVDGQEVRQHQYYLSPSFTTRGGFVFSPSFHYLRVSFQIPYLTGGMGPGGGNSIGYTEDYLNQYVGGLLLTRHQGTVDIRLGGIYSNLNDATQVTGKAGFTWFPLGNLRLYFSSHLNIHFGDLESGSLATITDLLFGWGIASRIWVELSGAYGAMQNYTESNGYIVYNGLDYMKYKVMGTVVVPISSRGTRFYAGARFTEYESPFYEFFSAQSTPFYSSIYNSLSIFGGLSWKF